MTSKEIVEKLEELAQKIKYGNATVEYTFSNGFIVKAVIKETQEVILFNKC